MDERERRGGSTNPTNSPNLLFFLFHLFFYFLKPFFTVFFFQLFFLLFVLVLFLYFFSAFQKNNVMIFLFLLSHCPKKVRNSSAVAEKASSTPFGRCSRQ